MTAQGIGASLSPAIGGWMSQRFGYSTTFVMLGCFALVSVALWIGFRRVVSAAATAPENQAGEPPSVEQVTRQARGIAG